MTGRVESAFAQLIALDQNFHDIPQSYYYPPSHQKKSDPTGAHPARGEMSHRAPGMAAAPTDRFTRTHASYPILGAACLTQRSLAATAFEALQ